MALWLIGFGALFLAAGVYLLATNVANRADQVTVVGPPDQTEINRLNGEIMSLRNQLQVAANNLTALQQQQSGPEQFRNFTFDFSAPPILKRKLIKPEAEVLIEKLNEVAKIFRDNQPPRFAATMPDTDPFQRRRRLLVNSPPPTLAERRDQIAAVRDAYIEFGKKLSDIVRNDDDNSKDLKSIIDLDKSLPLLSAAQQALNNYFNDLDRLNNKPQPVDPELVGLLSGRATDSLRPSMLRVEAWIDGFLNSRAAASRKEIEAFL